MKTYVYSVSNNNYILQPGDLVKVIKEIKYVGDPIIKPNSLYFVKETWNGTNGNIVLQKKTEEFDFSMEPACVDKVLNYNSTNKKKEAA